MPQGGLKQQVHGMAGNIEMHIAVAVAVAATGVIQVGQIELVDALVSHQLQHIRQFDCVVFGHGKAQPHLDIAIAAQADTLHGGIKCTLLAPEQVVCLFSTVNTDTHVVISNIGYGIDITGINQCTVA